MLTKQIHIHKLNSLNFWLWVLFILSFAIYFCGMPRYLDDLWYAIYIKDWREGIPGASLWQGIITTWREHLCSDNVRLANIVFVPFLALPKWVGSIIAAALLGIACVWCAQLTGVNPKKSPLIAISIFLWTFLLPWYDGMGVENFQFNYIYATFFAVLYLKLFLTSQTENKSQHNLLLCLLAFIIGIWHEGFTAPLLASSFILLMLYPTYRNEKQIYLLIGLTIGMIWFLAWPTSWQRLDNVYGETEKFTVARITFILAQHLSFITLCPVLIWTCCKRTTRLIFKNPIFITLLINIAVSLAIHFFTTRTPRTGWWCEFCSVAAILMLLSQLFPSLNTKYNLRNILLCSPLLLLTFANRVVVDYYSIRINHTFNKAIVDHLNSGQEAVFVDLDDEYRSPIICMYAPDFTALHSPVGITFINFYYHPQGNVSIIPVPEELRYTTANLGVEISPVTAGKDLHIREIEGRLFIPYDDEARGEIALDIDYGYSIKRGVRTIVYPYISEADGKRYAFLYPWRQVIPMRIGKVKAISPT